MNLAFANGPRGPTGAVGAPGAPGRPIYKIHDYESSCDQTNIDECICHIKKILSEIINQNKNNWVGLCSTIKYYNKLDIYESIKTLLDSIDYTHNDLIYLCHYAFVFNCTKITKLILKYMHDKFPIELNQIAIGTMLIGAIIATDIRNILFLLGKKKKLYIENNNSISLVETHLVQNLYEVRLWPTSLKNSIVFYSLDPTLLAMHNIYYFQLSDYRISDCFLTQYSMRQKFTTKPDLFSHICPSHLKILIAVALDSYQQNRTINPDPNLTILWSDSILDLTNPIFLIGKFMKKKDWQKITMIFELGKSDNMVDVFVNNIMYFYFYGKLYE